MEQKSGKYSWVPAGMEYPAVGGLMIYIRYGKWPNRIEVVEASTEYFRIRCPDRELVIVGKGNVLNTYRPMDSTFDECVSVGPYFEAAAKDLGYDYIMDNYTLYTGAADANSPKMRMKGKEKPKDGINIIADSGGFQLLRGQLDYIDPHKLAKWYSENVDIGMVLDVPSSLHEKKYVIRTAKVQAKNTDILMKEKRESLELFNIFHGNTMEEISLFRKYVERDDIDRLAIGGSYMGTILAQVARWCDIISTGRTYKHYHVLGVANHYQVLPLILMAQMGLAKIITSDSTTHVQTAVSKIYYLHTHVSEIPRMLVLGDKAGWPNPQSTLPCQCPVCTAIKYTDVLGTLTGQVSSLLLALHNLFARNTYHSRMIEFFKITPIAEAKKLFKFQFKPGMGRQGNILELCQTLDFLDLVRREGLGEAKKVFSYYLPNGDKKVHVGSNPLFVSADGEEPVTIETVKNKRSLSILRRYEGKIKKVKKITIPTKILRGAKARKSRRIKR